MGIPSPGPWAVHECRVTDWKERVLRKGQPPARAESFLSSALLQCLPGPPRRAAQQRWEPRFGKRQESLLSPGTAGHRLPQVRLSSASLLLLVRPFWAPCSVSLACPGTSWLGWRQKPAADDVMGARSAAAKEQEQSHGCRVSSRCHLLWESELCWQKVEVKVLDNV